ncbi:response regulator [Aerophototrophica crusticola]|uniref:Response regulator n=1 Tax=Aerophototrophica crusticola TaxID=1709002 RepID=A0A858R7G5_9PROT|nr:response regulator [Rhodospirillaceae bacterium B3]
MHVIVAEDEALVAMMFEAALSQAGYRVSLARDGQEALELLDQDPADAVVTDLRMPRMDGRDLILRLRARDPGLPILVVTGYQGDAGNVGRGTRWSPSSASRSAPRASPTTWTTC